MDEQMIDLMRDAIWNTLCPGIRRTAEDDARYEESARAAYSVMAGKVAELEGELREAWLLLHERAALAPHPERRSE